MTKVGSFNFQEKEWIKMKIGIIKNGLKSFPYEYKLKGECQKYNQSQPIEIKIKDLHNPL